MKAVQKMMVKNVLEHIKSWKDIKLDLSMPPDGAQPLQNQQCMDNAMNEYKSGRSVAIIEVVCYSKTQAVAHYISMTAEGKLYDATLGWAWSGGKMKLSRYVHPENGESMADALDNLKKKMFKMCSLKTRAIAKATGTGYYQSF